MLNDRFKFPLVVVWNPTSYAKESAALQADINRQIQPLFKGVHWYSVIRDEDASGRAVDDALGSGARTILVAGGDGTLNALARRLHEKNALDRVSVALFPLGTCNDTIRTLCWSRPRNIRSAVSDLPKLFGGQEVLRDLWTLNGELFVNNAGAGRAYRKDASKRRPLIDFLRMKPIEIRARWDRNEWEGKIYLVVASNGPYFSGGLHFRPDVDPADGALDVFLLQAFPKPRLLAAFWRGRRGEALNSPTPWAFHVRSGALRIESSADLWPQVDGEAQKEEPVHQLIFEKVPRKLTFLTYPKTL